MEIAPQVQAATWRDLDLNRRESADWPVACEILRRRIEERFLVPGDRLIAWEEPRDATDRRFGFVVMAIDCLLVETLGAFRLGRLDTRRKSEETFCTFLVNQPRFAPPFDEGLAHQFYEEFRCGILHQAEVGGRSKIWSVGPLIQRDGDSIITNRNEFHARLRFAFEDYIAELLEGENQQLRDHFRAKMDHIAR